MKLIKILILMLMFASIDNALAQQQVMFTQYMFNGLALNPAYAGSHESVSMTALVREQWSGLDGAPSTQTFSIHSPIKNHKSALGLLILNDKIGVTNQTGVFASYAYHLPFANGAKLSLGLQAGATYYDADFLDLGLSQNDAFNRNITEWQPNFGFGAYYYTDRFYLGVSVPQTLENTFDEEFDDSNSELVRHYFISSGYVFDLSQDLKFKPNILVKAVNNAPVEFDLNANFLIKELIWLGVSWRSFDSFDALFQLQVSPQLQIGYAYDFATTTDLRRVNSGSHEFMVNFRFVKGREKVLTPRYF